MRLHIERVAHVPENTDPKWPMPRHIVVKLLDFKSNQNKTASLCFEAKPQTTNKGNDQIIITFSTVISYARESRVTYLRYIKGKTVS